MKSISSRWLIVLALSALTLRTFAADPLTEVDKLAQDWVKMRVETVQADTAWRSQRELLETTLAAMKAREKTLEGKRDLARAKTATERKEIDALATKNRAAADDLKSDEVRLEALAKKLIALRPNLPPRLSEALEMPYRTLAEPDLSFGDRMQQAVNVLNRCAQFDGVVTEGEDVLTLPGEAGPKSLDVIYWGLSCGYAVDRTMHKAWLGRPGPDGWQWEPAPDAYDRVAHLIAVARDRADPAFVTIPARVTKSLTKTVGNQAP